MQDEALLAFFPKLTPKRYQDLARIPASFDEIWQANAQSLKQTGWDEELIREFISWREALNVEKIERDLQKEGIEVIAQSDERYPSLLKQLYDPPAALFVRGTLAKVDLCLAIVGTRKCTPYGRQVVEELVPQLVESGLTIVSGLALGIDGFAHEATLRAGGKTIAVLGSGVDRAHVFPTTHSDLANRIIASGGAVISEYPPGMMANTFTFPRRNRIVAGMSLGTLVTEAPEGSGALITAQCALDNNREVFAVPQNITHENAFGPNTLIKNGAHPVSTVEDILSVLHIEKAKAQTVARATLPDSPEEAALLPFLTREPIHIDFIAKQAKLPSHLVSGILTLMEMKGRVRNVGGMKYVIPM
ncbi:MAG: DNA-processing protein DprA [Patescibacteria group bacterium]